MYVDNKDEGLIARALNFVFSSGRITCTEDSEDYLEEIESEVEFYLSDNGVANSTELAAQAKQRYS